MSGITELYRDFRHGLSTNPGPEDPTFFELWRLYMDVTGLVSIRLTEPGMGGAFRGSDRVEVYLAWSEQATKICEEMPLKVPAQAVRAVKAAGRYLERTHHLEELGEFLSLSAPIAGDLGEYAAQGLGRHAKPVVDELSFVARAGTLMYESVARAVPGVEVTA